MKKYSILSFGCKVNQYESQLITEKFKNDNFEYVQKLEDADVIIVNSCTITEKADKKCEYFLRKISKLPNNPKILFTGCLAKNKNNHIKTLFPSIELIEDKSTLYKNSQKQIVLSFDKHSRAFLKIQDGCNSFCSYCIVPYIRNVFWSKPDNEVISEIINLSEKGYSEIVLTGINIGKYNGGFSKLLEKIIKISLNFRVRISSIELNEIDDKLIELMQANPEKICCHLHVPLQSGSNEITQRMNRKYSPKIFEDKINKIMLALPDLTLTTDIITGFPGETAEHHKETCNFIRQNPFAKLHIFRYSDRIGTKASTFTNKIKVHEIKNRSKELFEIDSIKRKKFLEKNIGKIRKAVKIGKNKTLTDNYITVQKQSEIEQSEKQFKGIFEVKITDTSKF
jgi:threonylcarbamoyladenosine tRNA methylthiotransferase MtaB